MEGRGRGDVEGVVVVVDAVLGFFVVVDKSGCGADDDVV